MSFTILVTLYYYLPHNPDDPKEENTVGKGENTGNQHFLLFPQCFLLYQREKSFYQFKIVICKHFGFGDSLKFVIWERVKEGCFT